MAKKAKKPNHKMQAWIDARKRHHLSHAQVQMARELGMNPAKLGKLDDHKPEPRLRCFLTAAWSSASGEGRRSSWVRFAMTSALCRAVSHLTGSSSSARLSRSTLTRGSPRMPYWRPSVYCCTKSRTRTSGSPRARATRRT